MRTRRLCAGLLLASVLLWQLGTWISPRPAQASEPDESCESACPCEQVTHAHDEAEHDDADRRGSCPDGACPPGCDDCACCPGGMVALTTGLMTVPHASYGRAEFLAPSDEPASVPNRRLFIPPESSLA